MDIFYNFRTERSLFRKVQMINSECYKNIFFLKNLMLDFNFFLIFLEDCWILKIVFVKNFNGEL